MKVDCEESWVPKNWCFWTVVLEKTLESPLDCNEIQPAHPKGDQSWVFTGRNDVQDETPILWPPDAKSWLIGKDPDAGKDWGQEEKETTEDEIVGWRHQLNGHGFGWTLGVCDGQGGLECCSSWGRKELDKTVQLNWTELNWCKQENHYHPKVFNNKYFSKLTSSMSVCWQLTTWEFLLRETQQSLLGHLALKGLVGKSIPQ